MIHIKGYRTQPCLTPDLIQKQLLSSFPSISAAVLFSFIALNTLMYLSGIPYKNKTFAKAPGRVGRVGALDSGSFV